MDIRPILNAMSWSYKILPNTEHSYLAAGNDNIRLISDKYGATPALQIIANPWNLPLLAGLDADGHTIHILDADFRVIGSWTRDTGYNILNFLNDNTEAYFNDWGKKTASWGTLASRLQKDFQFNEGEHNAYPVLIYSDGQFRQYKKHGHYRIGYLYSADVWSDSEVSVYDMHGSRTDYTVPSYEHLSAVYHIPNMNLYTGLGCGLYVYYKDKDCINCFSRATGQLTRLPLPGNQVQTASLIKSDELKISSNIKSSVPMYTRSALPVETYYNGSYYGGVYIEGGIFSGDYSCYSITTIDMDAEPDQWYKTYNIVNTEITETAGQAAGRADEQEQGISFEAILQKFHHI